MTVRPGSEMGARLTQGKLPSPPDPAPDGPADDGQSVGHERGGRSHGRQRPGDPAVIPELPYGEQYAHGHPDEVDVTAVSVAAQGMSVSTRAPAATISTRGTVIRATQPGAASACPERSSLDVMNPI